MKLIFIGNTTWSMYNFRRSIFQHFIQQGHEVIILAPKDIIYQQLLIDMGCKYYSLRLESKGSNPFTDIRTMLNIRRVLKSEKPDCCFFYTIKPNIYGSFAASSLHVPYIPITTGLGYTFTTQNWISKIAKILYKIAFRKAMQVWFLNKEDAEAFISNKLIEKNKVHILKGEGINVSNFEVHHENKNISFLLTARMLWDKGIGEFVEAARILKKKYPEVSFNLLGFLGVNNPNAITKEQMDIWVKEGDINYLGETSDVRPYIYNSTCIVLPSSYREGIPFSLMEGAAAGKPLIATDNIGCKEVIEDKITGYLCKIKDPNSLAQCMEKIILMSPEAREEMGEKGRIKMKNEFDIELIVQQYQKIIDKINNRQ